MTEYKIARRSKKVADVPKTPEGEDPAPKTDEET